MQREREYLPPTPGNNVVNQFSGTNYSNSRLTVGPSAFARFLELAAESYVVNLCNEQNHKVRM